MNEEYQSVNNESMHAEQEREDERTETQGD